MKMTKKKTALLALFAVSVIALAGIGYATVYKSQTVNSANSAEGNYITATQNSWTGNFSGVVALDTYTDNGHKDNAPIYVLNGGNTRIGETNYYGKVIGSEVTVTVAEEVTATITGWTLDATISQALPTGWHYYLKITDGEGNNGIFVDISSRSFTNQTINTTLLPVTGGTLKISLYVAGTQFQLAEPTPIYLDTYTGFGCSTSYDGEVTWYAAASVVFTLNATA